MTCPSIELRPRGHDFVLIVDDLNVPINTNQLYPQYIRILDFVRDVRTLQDQIMQGMQLRFGFFNIPVLQLGRVQVSMLYNGDIRIGYVPGQAVTIPLRCQGILDALLDLADMLRTYRPQRVPIVQLGVMPTVI